MGREGEGSRNGGCVMARGKFLFLISIVSANKKIPVGKKVASPAELMDLESLSL